MANVMNLSNVKNKPSRNGFDLSKRLVTTANCGALLPIFVEDVVPSDKFKINLNWFTRTSPLNSCAYTRILEHVSFYFVPYRLLYRYSDSIMSGLNNPQFAQSYQSPSEPRLKFPTFTNKDLADNYFGKQYFKMSNSLHADDGLGNRLANSCRLLESLGYGDFSYACKTDKPNTPEVLPLNPLRLLAYQKIYQDFYRFEQWESIDPNCFNIDYLTPNSVISVESLLGTKLQLNARTYENYNNNPFVMRYANYTKDLFTGILPSPQYGGTSYVDVQTTGDLSGSLSFGLQSVSTSGQSQFGVVASAVKPTSSDYILGISDDGSSDGVPVTVPLADFNVGDYVGRFDVLQLRQAQALQKWKEVTNAHRKSYKAQIEAHFGTSVADVRADMSQYLGGNTSALTIGEVANTNLSESPQVNISGKGIGQGKDFIEFQAPEHGIIMGIYYNEPVVEYSQDYIDNFNMKSDYTDYLIPELDKLGMQPLNVIDIFGINGLASKAFLDNENAYIGYVPRYAEYKTRLDRVSTSAIEAYKAWVTPVSSDNYFWKATTGSVPDTAFIDYQTFKIKSTVLNPIFVAQQDYKYNGYMRDQFLINFDFNVSAVRPLDFNGLPY